MNVSDSSPIPTNPAWRHTLVLAGDAAWGRDQAVRLWQEGALWIGEAAPAGLDSLSADRAHQVLGRELSLLVFDAHAGLDPDALGATAGAIRGGGLLVLLTPPLATWPDSADPDKARYASHPATGAAVTGHFLRRLAGLLTEARGVQVITEGEALTLTSPGPNTPHMPAPDIDPPCLSADQASAVAALLRVARGHRRRPLVISADRGRGKSAALGIAAARLLAEGAQRIIVTAPRPAAVAAVFEHAQALLPDAQRQGRRLSLPGGELRFMAPDALLREAPQADLVLVDEAAAIPVPVLTRLLMRHARIAFASTVHGYEGNGRGFALRFRAELDARTPQWRDLTLTTPIRYPVDDPLAAWVSRALLLDAEPAQLPASPAPHTITPAPVTGEALVADEGLLRQTFGLLVQAHYQTRPSDLRQLLDAPGLTLWLARADDQVLAVCVVLAEGGLAPELAAEVAAGRRRPQGHLIPQSLAAHTGQARHAEQGTARVMRIAVHPALRRQGLGRRLLAAVAAAAADHGMDWFGASFAADPASLAFWQAAGCRTVRVGAGRDGASGSYSVTLLRPLSDAALDDWASLRARCLAGLAHGLGDTWRDMEPAVAVALLRDAGAMPAPDTTDLMEVADYAAGRRDLAACQLGLWRWLLWRLGEGGVDGTDLDPLVRRLLQRWSDAQVVAASGLSGRAQLHSVLRAAVAALLTEPVS